MRVKVVSGFCLGAGRDVLPSEVLDLEPYQAHRLIGLGFVVAVSEAPASPMESAHGIETLAVGEIVNREPEPENREPRRRRGKGE